MSFTSRNEKGKVGDESSPEDEMLELDFQIDSDEQQERSLFENPFSKRQELREVDQSVNLMNAEKGDYEYRTNKERKKCMSELFLKVLSAGSGQEASDKSRKKKNLEHSRLTLQNRWMCGKQVLIGMAAVAATILLISPIVWDQIVNADESSSDIAAAESQLVTTAPHPDIPTPMPTIPPYPQLPSTAEKEEEQSAQEGRPLQVAVFDDSPFFSAEVVRHRRKAMDDLLLSADGVVTRTSAAQEAICRGSLPMIRHRWRWQETPMRAHKLLLCSAT